MDKNIKKLGIGLLGEYPSSVATPQGGNKYVVNITQDFGDGYTFDGVVALLSNATEFDDIVFNINSCGGYLFSVISLQNAISTTQARVHMVLLGQAASAGGLLFLTEGVSSYSVGKNTMLMIHPIQCGGGYGSAAEGKVRADANAELNERVVRSGYKDFLTEEEIDDVIFNNKEIYMFEEEINDRLSKRVELRKKQLQDKIDAIESDIDELDLSEFSDEDLKQERDLINKELRRRNKKNN